MIMKGDQLLIRRPDDMHVHFRTGTMLRNVVKYTAQQFGRALVMPNTDPAILNGSDVATYREAIMACVDDRFQPLMTFKITPSTSAEDAVSAKAAGALAGKLYPDGVTTNSEGGVRDFRRLYPLFAAMQDLNLVLCLHGEHPDAECMDREQRFIHEVFGNIVTTFPKLRVVLEHISTAAGVDAVLYANRSDVAGTITAHHLELTHTDVFGGMLRPHLFCKPIAKWNKDRDALLQMATSGSSKFFFGSDTAPHARDKKECAEGCAGVFTAPVILPVLASLFEREGKLDMLEPFVSESGATFYGLPLNEGFVTLVHREWTVPDEYDDVVPYRAGETLSWSLG